MGLGKGKLQNELGHVPPIQLDSDFARFNLGSEGRTRLLPQKGAPRRLRMNSGEMHHRLNVLFVTFRSLLHSPPHQ
jgi:hypothetical protein